VQRVSRLAAYGMPPSCFVAVPLGAAAKRSARLPLLHRRAEAEAGNGMKRRYEARAMDERFGDVFGSFIGPGGSRASINKRLKPED
jgi:hypothetical protein